MISSPYLPKVYGLVIVLKHADAMPGGIREVLV